MDDKMMQQLLATYGKGIPLNAQNANRIREFGASNPEVLEKRAMGMRGSALDDNSDLLDAMLDRHIADTAGTPADTMGAEPRSAERDPVPPPSRRGAGPNNAAPVNRPAMARNKQDAQYGEGTGPQLGPPNDTRVSGFQSGPNLGGTGVSPVATPQGGALPQTAEGSGSNLMPWILSALGLSAPGALASAGAPVAGARGASPDMLQLPAPAPKLPSSNVTQLPSGAPEIPKSGIYDATKGNAQAQVDAENDDMMRSMMRDAEKGAAQRRAGETVNAAKRAVGRR